MSLSKFLFQFSFGVLMLAGLHYVFGLNFWAMFGGLVNFWLGYWYRGLEQKREW